MTVSELIEKLKDLPQDMEVMIDLTDYSENSETTMFKFHNVEFVGDIKDATGEEFVMISPIDYDNQEEE
jgi:hypothetical protein